MKLKFIFISYSWDSDEHKAWVKKFSDDLQAGLGAEYEVLLDQNQPRGTDLGLFMQRGITMAEKVMIIGTTKYKEKSQNYLGSGVAYEGSIIREEKIANIATTKFYTILREGSFSTSFPPGLGNTLGDDLSKDENYDKLLPSIIEEIRNPKPISGIFEQESSCVQNNSLSELKSNEKSAEFLTFIVRNVSFKMIRIEGGTFMMGANVDDEDVWYDEKPAHQVTVSTYYIGETEVNQSLWQAIMNDNPSRFKGPNRPVERVNYFDCLEFIEKLNSSTGMKFRLPTEAEWEFAARGGNKSKRYKFSGSKSPNEVAWYRENSGNETHDVAQKRNNELGLFDMNGNIWEWCSDWYSKDYYSNSPQINPQGPERGQNRVYRGGCWYSIARYSRVSYRNADSPFTRNFDLGLRLALSV